MKLLLPILFVFVGLAIAASVMFKNKLSSKTIINPEQVLTDSLSIHHLVVEPLLSDDGIELSKYKGKVMLVVNVASKCGLTPQYEDLQALHEEMADSGLAILGFPSNDFLKQEPGTEEEIATFCQRNYGVEFDMFEKVKVRGDKHPIYQFLTQKDKNGVLDSEVSWNFQKYLLDKEGHLIAVFNPRVKVTEPEVRNEIKRLLEQ